MLNSRRRAGKWRFSTNSLSCLPVRKASQARRNTQWLVFSSPRLARCQEMLFWGTAGETPYSALSSSPAKKPRPRRCLARLRSCPEASGHSRELRHGPLCAKSQPWQLRPRGLVLMQHLSAQASNPSSHPALHSSAGGPHAERLPWSRGSSSDKALRV